MCDWNPCKHKQDCIVNPEGGYWCVCPAGMEMSADGTQCQPISRTCDSWGACSQECVTIGDHKVKCFCHGNYTMQPDLYTCKHNGEINQILKYRHNQ